MFVGGGQYPLDLLREDKIEDEEDCSVYTSNLKKKRFFFGGGEDLSPSYRTTPLHGGNSTITKEPPRCNHNQFRITILLGFLTRYKV